MLWRVLVYVLYLQKRDGKERVRNSIQQQGTGSRRLAESSPSSFAVCIVDGWHDRAFLLSRAIDLV